MRNLILYICVNFILLTSCVFNNNGFKITNNNLNTDLLVFDSLMLKRVVNYNGYFIIVSYKYCKEISIFYPDVNGSSEKKPDIKSIVRQLNRNFPSQWTFFYCPIGWENTIAINKLKDTCGLFGEINFFNSSLSSYLNDTQSVYFHEKIGNYRVHWSFYSNLSFWEAECTTSSLNNYLTRRRNFISTTNKKYYKCKVPYYYFIDDKKMTILLPKRII